MFAKLKAAVIRADAAHNIAFQIYKVFTPSESQFLFNLSCKSKVITPQLGATFVIFWLYYRNFIFVVS